VIGEEYVLSGWWRRVGATLIDGALITLATTLTLWLAGFDLGRYYVDEGPFLSFFLALRDVDIVYALVDAAFATLYFTPLMLAWDGQTVGKRVTHITVIRADRRPLDVSTVLLRQTLVQSLFGLVYGLAIVDSLLPLADRENRAGHDFIARTRVVLVPRL